jgi:hypothetical protein
MDYNFEDKRNADKFVSIVNLGENTQYCEAWNVGDTWQVIKDRVTGKYYEDFTPVTTPPQLFPFACVIPTDLQMPFRNGVFRLSGFEVPLETINGKKAVNVAYLYWKEFRAELDRKDDRREFVHQAIKDNLMDLWDFVELHANTIEPWMADPVNNQLSEFIIYIQ